MNMKARSKLLLPLSLTALLAGGGVLYSQYGTPLGTYAQAQSEHNVTTTNVTAIRPLNQKQALLQDETNTIDIVKTYGPSVVSVNVSIPAQPAPGMQGGQGQLQNIPPQFRQFFQQFGGQFGPGFGGQFGQPGQPAEQGAGSGFVVDQQGQLMTNYHVVKDALKANSTALKRGAKLTVTFTGSKADLPVKVIGVNPSYDLALLELTNKNDLPKGVQPIGIANSNSAQVGQKVVAIGNPFGLESTVTTGIISAIGRDFTSVGQFNFPVIQTDAPINPGNSGGPLLDSQGQLVGINAAILPGVGPDGQGAFLGIGFAIPGNVVSQNLASLEKGGFTDVYNSKARLGVQVQDVSSYPEGLRNSLGLPSTGELVVAVEPGSPAAKAGLKGSQFTVNVDGQQLPAGGDVIVSVDGQKLSDSQTLQNVIFSKKAGDTVQLGIVRGGRDQTLTVKLEVVPLKS